ncbi:MAG: hypothetical protein AB7F86_20625 [Bdellovibrionales bacterium]
MINLHGDFPSRVSARAVLMGTISTFALMMILLILGAVWNPDLLELSQTGFGFWIWAFVAWSISLYVSAYVAAAVGRSVTGRDGAYHGFAIWANTCLLGCGFFALVTGRLLGILPEGASSSTLFGIFLGDAIAMGAALLGGANGAASESRVEASEAKTREQTSTFQPAHAR